MNDDDSSAIYALVLYPENLRLSIFESCKYPEAIVRITGLQQKTSNAFVELIGNYSRQEQEDLWDLTRYPDPVSYTHLRAHETVLDLVCRLLLEKKKT